MPASSSAGQTIPVPRLAALFCLFLAIAMGLGYPVLNRYDSRQTPGLSDVKTYAAMVTGDAPPGSGHLRFRVLVPWVARPFYYLAQQHVASWDPVLFGLLVSDSIFVAATAVLIVLLGRRLVSPTAALLGAFVYLVNFAVPNLRLAGLVDAAEGFLLLALLYSLVTNKLWMLPLVAVFGVLAKESFIPFSLTMTAAWWLAAWRQMNRTSNALWILSAWAVAVATMMAVQTMVSGTFVSPVQFGLSLHGGHEYLRHLEGSLLDRNFWYIFAWLLPTAIPGLRKFPGTMLIPIAAASALAFALDSYYGGAPGTVGRALFSIAGPTLSLSSAQFFLRIVE